MDDFPDVPLENFGADTEVATPPVASETTAVAEAPAETSEQTAPETDTSGSEPEAAQPPADNPIVEEDKSGRPEKQDRLQNRFGELTGKIRERDAELEKLQAQLAQMQATGLVKPLQPNAEGEYSIEEIQRFNQQNAEAIANSRVSQLEQRLEVESIANRFDSEGNTLETKYAKDFADNPIHLENIRADIEEKVALAGKNPEALKQISPIKIAERYMKGVESERRKSQTTSAQNLQTIQAENAVNPEGAPTSVDPTSDAALEARVSNIKF